LLEAAVADGTLTWTPFAGHEAALERVDGAAAGLSLAADTSATRRWAPQAIQEYMARGVPTVATATPQARGLVQASGAGLVIGHDDLAALQRAIRWLLDHDDERHTLAEAAHAAARNAYDWAPHAERFVGLFEHVSEGGAG
jgi:glycosyltransferase involved in cell wall biosynthesis